MTRNSPLVRCCFCGRSQNDVPRLVASATSATAICGPCAIRVVEVLVTGRDEPPEPPVVLTPAGRRMVEAQVVSP